MVRGVRHLGKSRREDKTGKSEGFAIEEERVGKAVAKSARRQNGF